MATNQNDPTKDPSIPSQAYTFMAPKWGMIETLLGGTSSMRCAGEDYLPRHSAESQTDYDNRLSQAVLYNVLELTLESLVGRVFREELRLNDDVPEQIAAFGPNIDLQNNTISSFCSLWFRESLAKGYAHCYIDMPAIDEAAKATRTLADDQKQNNRPFWSLIKPENFIFGFYEEINGVETLTHARIVEYTTTMQGFAEVRKTQIRVLTPGNWAIWINETEGQKQRKPKWVEQSSGTYDLPIIPIVTYYTNKQAPMLAKPPLEDLAYLNIRHWQSNSDQINVLTVARFPMLASSGAQVEAGKSSQPIGPRQLLTMRDPNGRFYYVEHSGKAIQAGADDLEKLEDQMAAYGAEFLRRQVAGRTAFERAADGNEAVSVLKRMGIEFGKAVEQALKITGQWINVTEDTGTVTVNLDYTQEDSEITPEAMSSLTEARKRGDISRKTWFGEMQRRGFVDPAINWDDEQKQLAKEFEEGPHPPTYFIGTQQIRDNANVQPGSDQAITDGDVQEATPTGGTTPPAGTKNKQPNPKRPVATGTKTSTTK